MLLFLFLQKVDPFDLALLGLISDRAPAATQVSKILMNWLTSQMKWTLFDLDRQDIHYSRTAVVQVRVDMGQHFELHREVFPDQSIDERPLLKNECYVLIFYYINMTSYSY